MTHEELRKRAVQWLTGTQKCGVVLSEMVSMAGEIPDAVGWKYGKSIVVECKTSRSDFHADRQKTFLRTGRAVGSQRFYFCAKGLLNEEDVRGTEHGLLWLNDSNIVRVVVPAPYRERDETREIDMLVSALRRVKAREFLVLVPEIGTEEGARP